jgi:hypothetical protein
LPRGERWQLFRRRGLEVTETEADNLPRSARRHAGVDGERKFGEIEIRKCGKTILKKEIGTTDDMIIYFLCNINLLIQASPPDDRYE